ncbi:VOC family protein [Lacticaseibacillus mingshuiensis]|uniref:Uncharacterized protein n=1 Tax=Lacticaseibacillus mingshuiensis TaxID=2799574 RepID=A0ABW4CKD5_9LACO|nr:hypothetical protein [Lacticaseibacillus mingshuiensis]
MLCAKGAMVVKGHFILDAATRIGFIALKVAEAEPVADWYRQMGFETLQEKEKQVMLGIHADRKVLLILQEVVGLQPNGPLTGLSGFSVMLPTRPSLLAAYRRVSAREKVQGFTTTWGLGFTTVDPLGNAVTFAYDEEGPTKPPGYRWRSADRIAAAPALFAGGADERTMPVGTTLGQLVVRVHSLAETLPYVTQVLGFDELPGKQSPGQFSLTVGNATMHIMLTLEEDPRALPPMPDHFGAKYVNLVVPNTLILRLLRANLATAPGSSYHYDEKKRYLMAAGPNRLTMWFSVL